MQLLIWQMFEADAYNETRSAMDTNFRHDSAYASLYTDIFRTHHITRADFNDSYNYYMSQPDVLRTMVDSLVEKKSRDLRQGPPKGSPGSPGHPTPYQRFQPGGHPTTPFPPPPGGHPPAGFHPPGMPQRPGMPPGARPGMPPALKPGALPAGVKPKPGPKTPTGKPTDL